MFEFESNKFSFLFLNSRALSNSNKGYKMLQKMGWTSGEPLGKQHNGNTEPVRLLFQIFNSIFSNHLKTFLSKLI
jgi:hypothetical protein